MNRLYWYGFGLLSAVMFYLAAVADIMAVQAIAGRTVGAAFLIFLVVLYITCDEQSKARKADDKQTAIDEHLHELRRDKHIDIEI